MVVGETLHCSKKRGNRWGSGELQAWPGLARDERWLDWFWKGRAWHTFFSLLCSGSCSARRVKGREN